MIKDDLLIVNQKLSNKVDKLNFSVDMVYNPLNYAWDGFTQYLKYANSKKRVVFLGMNLVLGEWLKLESRSAKSKLSKIFSVSKKLTSALLLRVLTATVPKSAAKDFGDYSGKNSGLLRIFLPKISC